MSPCVLPLHKGEKMGKNPSLPVLGLLSARTTGMCYYAKCTCLNFFPSFVSFLSLFVQSLLMPQIEALGSEFISRMLK